MVWLGRILRLPRRRLRSTMVLLSYSLLASSSYMVMRTIADSLLLARLGTKYLAWVFVVASLASIVTTVLVTRVSMSLKMRRVAQATRIGLFVTTIMLAWLLGPYHHAWPVVCGLYLLAEVRGTLNSIQLIALVAERFKGRSSHQAIAVVTTGGPIAGILVGTVLSIEAREFALVNWLYVAAGCDLFAVVVLGWDRYVSPRVPAKSNHFDSPKAPDQANDERSDRKPIRSYAYSLGGIVGSMIFVITFISFQWKVAAANVFEQDEAGLARFFAEYYLATDSIILFCQLFIATRLLRGGVTRFVLALYPILLGFAALGLTIARTPISELVCLTAAKGLDVYRRGLHDPTLTTMYTPLGSNHQRPVITAVNGVVKPVSEASAAIGVGIAELFLSVTATTVVWILWLIPWTFAAHYAGSFYQSFTRNESDPGHERDTESQADLAQTDKTTH